MPDIFLVIEDTVVSNKILPCLINLHPNGGYRQISKMYRVLDSVEVYTGE